MTKIMKFTVDDVRFPTSKDLTGSDAIINNATFIGNNANRGGGVYIELGEATITNALINDNTATTGGGIYLSEGSIEIINSTIVYNLGSYGIYGHATQPEEGQVITIVMDISNSIVWGNAGSYQFYFENQILKI